MPSSKQDKSGKSTGTDPDVRDLRLEEGECVTASPSSPRFAADYQQYRPQSIDEAREVLGVTADAVASVAEAHRNCCNVPGVLSARLVTPGELTAEDAATRESARELAHAAGRAYVRGLSTTGLEQWKSTLDEYVRIGRAVLNVLVLNDIDIANGATLTLSANTHALYAAHITIHGSGRIVCHGDVTIRATSVEGITPPRVSKASAASAAAMA